MSSALFEASQSARGKLCVEVACNATTQCKASPSGLRRVLHTLTLPLQLNLSFFR